MNSLFLNVWRNLPLSKNLQLTVMRLFQNQFLVGVGGVIFNEKDEILLFRHTYEHNPWGLPRGYLKAKEHPREGLEREIEEESGLIVAIDDRLKIRTDRDTARLDICYTGTYLAGDFKPSDEVVGYGFFSFDRLPLLTRDQLMLIDLAIKKRKAAQPFPLYTYPHIEKPHPSLWQNLREYLSP